LAEERHLIQKEKMMKRERERRESNTESPVVEKQEKPVSLGESPIVEKREKTVSLVSDEAISAVLKAKAEEKKMVTSRTKESQFSSVYRELEFLPYNPLPIELDELIFPEKSRPLQIFDDPYWPSKASCVKLVETLGEASSSLSAYTGTYLSPGAKGVKTGSFFKIVPYPVPPYLRQQPRCTDIVELPFSLQAMDHLYPVQYRSQLQPSKRHTENGLKQVLINAVSDAMGKTLSFEESGEAVYAAMVKNGPNWALFVVASLYWRVSGELS
jgi:hypothetical protein